MKFETQRYIIGKKLRMLNTKLMCVYTQMLMFYNIIRLEYCSSLI